MEHDDYATMKELGQLFGATSHVIGRKLKELGLRTDDGKPSAKAFELELPGQRFTDDYQHYCWAWHRVRTIAVLEKAGMKKVIE